jgi:hypothetical protein
MSCARAVQAPIWHVCGDAGDRRRRREGGRRKSSRNVSFYECETRIFLLLHLAGFSNRRSNRKAASQREREREREREFHHQLLQKQQQALMVAYFFVLSREMEWKVFWFRSSCNGQRTGKKLK